MNDSGFPDDLFPGLIYQYLSELPLPEEVEAESLSLEVADWARSHIEDMLVPQKVRPGIRPEETAPRESGDGAWPPRLNSLPKAPPGGWPKGHHLAGRRGGTPPELEGEVRPMFGSDPDRTLDPSSPDAESWVGRYAVCALGRIGRIEGVHDLEFGRTFVGTRLHDGQFWASTAPRVLDEADAMALDRLRRTAEIDIEEIVVAAVRKALSTRGVTSEVARALVLELRDSLRVGATPPREGREPDPRSSRGTPAPPQRPA